MRRGAVIGDSPCIPRRRAACVLGVCAALLAPARAFACGVSSVDGSWSCSWADYEEAVRPRWQVGAAGLHTRAELRFGDDAATQTRNAVIATLGYAPTPELTLQASAGAALAGELQMPGEHHDFLPGPTFAAGIVYRLLSGLPFVAVSGVLAASFARTEQRSWERTTASYTALDLRAGVVAGVTLFDVVSPYAVARVFGGPVFWRYQGEAVTGTDLHHYQLGLGLTVRPFDALVVFVEGVPLGERALSYGASVVF